MAENSAIEWTSHTFNAWRGCTKVSDGCKNCYAETLSGRNPKVLGEWGPKGSRVIAAESYWKEPLKWNREAEQAGKRRRVFCASLADVFEGMETMPKESYPLVEAARQRLWSLIEQTPHLDWLLLTKRPEYIIHMVPVEWRNQFPSNVWIGTSVENQQAADERIPHLLQVPAKVRFLSCEPLLGPVNLDRGYILAGTSGVGCFPLVVKPSEADRHCWGLQGGINWVIVGGESGPHARPMHPEWARSLRDQCEAAGVPFFFKQWGSFSPDAPVTEGERLVLGIQGKVCGHFSKRVGVCTTGPEDHPTADMFPVGKKAAGRLLDGRTWDELPEVMR